MLRFNPGVAYLIVAGFPVSSYFLFSPQTTFWGVFYSVFRIFCPRSTVNRPRSTIIVLLAPDSYSFRNSYYVLRIAYCVLRIAYCVLRIAYCVLRIAYCVLRIAYCVLRIA